jgi:hypothetical protein
LLSLGLWSDAEQSSFAALNYTICPIGNGVSIMMAGVAGGDKISERLITKRLQESLARLRRDIDRVELWAGALEGFSQPIPDYDAARRYRLTPDKDGSQEDGDTKGQASNPPPKPREPTAKPRV